MSKYKKYCCLCRSKVDNSIKLIKFPKEESERKIWMDRLGMNRERYKPWMVFCEGHLRADKRNIGGSSKKMHNPRKFSLQNKTNSSDVKFETAVVDVSTKQKQETPCKVQDDDMSIEMLQDQSLLGKLPAKNSADDSNMCVRELIYTSQFPVIFSESIDWDILKWTVEDWSNAFRGRFFQFRCGTKKCQKSPFWESQCETEYHTFEELITFSKDESLSKDRWWYFDYKSISENFPEEGDLFKTISWGGLGFPEKGAENSTIWVGSPGAHTPCHFDSYGCNVVAQIFGKKRWILFPPSETENLLPTRVPYEESSVYSRINFFCSRQLKENLKLNKCYVVDMNAGDVLLIPPKWWHYVENITLAASINMWIPVKDDDISRLDEALVRFLISSLTNNAPDNMKNFILNPNELDLKGGSINLQIIEFCRKTIEGASEKISVETKNDLYDSTSHKHKYKIIRPISIFEFKKILPNCSNCQYEITSEELFLEDHVDTLTTIINAFCHPDIIGQIREKFLH